MTVKWSVATACLAAGLAAGIAGAQEPAPAPTEPPAAEPAAPPATTPTPQAEESFFGDRFALYLEVRAGTTSADDIQSPVNTTNNLRSDSELRLQNVKNGEFTVGWTLPRDRGQYLFTYSGVADGSYDLDATGYQRAYFDPQGGTPITLNNPAPWWTLGIRDGQLRSTQSPPTWDPTVNDTDGDGFPDDSELIYPTTNFDLQKSVPDDLGTQFATYDLYYRREFGGTRYHARWTAGGRYFNFDGAVPVPMWITVAQSVPGTGFSEGFQNPIVIMEQDSSGWGPVGSGEAQFNFFRRRLQLYAMVKVALIFIDTSTDSHVFEFMARDITTGNLVPRQGRIATDISKSTWHSTFEAGVRFRIVQGLHVFLDWNKSGYLDAFVLPTKVSLPQDSGQIDQPIGVSWKSRDLVLSTVQLGLSFQF